MKRLFLNISKIILSITLVLLLSTIVFTMVSCSGTSSNSENNITINKSSLSLAVGDTFQLKVLNDDTEVLGASWSSEGDCVIVDDGLVTALKVGQSIVKATIKGQVVNCVITINTSKTVPLFELNTSGELYLMVGDVFTLVPSLTYQDESVEVTKVDYQFLGNTIIVEKLTNECCNITANKSGAVEVLAVCDWNNILLYQSITIIIT